METIQKNMPEEDKQKEKEYVKKVQKKTIKQLAVKCKSNNELKIVQVNVVTNLIENELESFRTGVDIDVDIDDDNDNDRVIGFR